MDLKTFVSEALTQIVEGIRDAQERTKDSGATISPYVTRGPEKNAFIASGHHAQAIDFDVAVTATEGTGTKGGIGVVIAAFTLGSTGESRAETSATSRIKFTVPVVLPEESVRVR